MPPRSLVVRIAETAAPVRLFFLVLIFAVGVKGNAAAQETRLTLSDAVGRALENYPTLRTAQATAQAARSQIDVARTTYLPRVDLLGQVNRATFNNVSGLLLPQPITPPISGVPVDNANFSTAFGSATGALLSYEPFDFGRRRASVDFARAGARQAEAGIQITRLDVAANAVDAFLLTAMTEQTARAARADVERQRLFVDAVRVLVTNELRPGADLSRAEVNYSDARIRLLQAEQSTSVNRSRLAEAIGAAGAVVEIDPAAFAALPPATELPATNFERHPRAVTQQRAVETVRARREVLDKSYLPRFNFQLSLSSRGTGVLNDGRFEGGLNGLLPTTPNLAAGVSVTFGAFDIFDLRARRRVERANEVVEQARLTEVTQTLTAQEAEARALVEGARRIAAETPVKLAAARAADEQARARYRFGLTDVTEVADAQRQLVQAEADDAVARLNVYRALLARARAAGDINLFLQRAVGAPPVNIQPASP